MHDRFNVFVSSTSSDLGECRNRVRELLQSYCIDVTVQEKYPVTASSTFEEIDDKIARADLVICLVGYTFGMALPQTRPHGVPDNMSWTQYEVWKAGKEIKRRMVFFLQGNTDGLAKDPHRINQEKWRDQLLHELHIVGGTNATFDRDFKTAEELVSVLQQWLDHDETIEAFRRRRWADAVDRYRGELVARWQKAWPNEFHGETNHAPVVQNAPTYIANQGFEELLSPEDHLYLRHLKPAAFVVGRETEAEARADTGDWRDVDLPALKERITSPDPTARLTRLFMVSGGGVGKSKSLERLAYLINSETNTDREQPSILACSLLASRLGTEADVIPLLARQLAESSVFKEYPFRQEEIERRLRVQNRQGRLVLFIDGLDHINVDEQLPPFLYELESTSWRDRPVVVSGRPYAVQRRFIDITDSSASHSRCITTAGWTFCRPREFDESQQRAYLGTIGDRDDRYDLIPADARKILSVPRVLEYVRRLNETDLRRIQSTADVYFRAIPEMIRKTMAEAHSTRQLDPIAMKTRADNMGDIKDHQVEYVVTILAAAAFVMTKGDGDHPNFDHVQVKGDFLREVYHRIKRFGRSHDDEPEIQFSTFQEHFKDRLAAINAVVSNGILDAEPTGSELRDLIWSNKSVQCFFAAYWLSAHAAKIRWQYNQEEFDYDDSTQFAAWVWYHESQADENDEFYEINRFLAEMPDDAKVPATWLNSIKVWFEPNQPWRSAEMMYRAWPHLLRCAGEPLHDWWNVPYESIFQRRQSVRPALINRRPVVGGPSGSKSRELARQILAAFRGELQGLLDKAVAEPGNARAQAAREFIDHANWKTVPAGQFQMGFPIELHDHRSKTDACWRRMLDTLVTSVCNHVAQHSPPGPTDFSTRIAEETNTPIWFSGAQGKRFRKLDVAWLKGVLQSLEQATYCREWIKRQGAGDEEIQRANEEFERTYCDALSQIKQRWWPQDQTPRENPQHVAEFEMHRFPVLHKWFWLFAAGHCDSVRMYLDSKQEFVTERLRHPGDNHPVIYISWFDAWAFCQWANWTCPSSGVQYHCRLPHEPEWEFAARRAPSSDGAGDGGPIPFNQPYWWGKAFYRHEFTADTQPSAEPEQISERHAHAIGSPALTRPPEEATPNGFGFHDILGNVWEWTASIYRESAEDSVCGYSRHEPRNLSATSTIELRTMRGGLWYFLDLLARCSDRFRLYSDDRDYKMGFRVIREEIRGNDI